MKSEIKEILAYMEGEKEILALRDQVKDLDERDAASLKEITDQLQNLAGQNEEPRQNKLGYYLLLLGCACHANEEYEQASAHLKSALKQLRGSKNNKAVAHWLLSINYSSLKQFEKARKELVKAERLSKARTNAMQERVQSKISDMFNDPIFALVPPEPTARKNSAAPQSAPEAIPPLPQETNAITKKPLENLANP